MSTLRRKAKVARRSAVGSTATAPRSQLHSIPIEQLHRHPDNRTITAESVSELEQSLREHGQKEPIRVRALPDPIGHYEIISGERRFVAAGLAGLDTLTCIVERHDDAAALLELAVANAARQDLDPIERAELLQKLIDSGMDREAAGRIFGLGSESGVKNALRLLRLPAYYRELLASKQINVQQARLLVPYPDAFLDALAEYLQAKKTAAYERAHFFDDVDGTQRALRMFSRDHTRPMDKRKHNHGYQLGDYRALFKPNSAQTAELVVCTIPDRSWNAKAGAEVLVALNTKLWHSLQDPLVKIAAAKKAAKKTKSPGSSTPTPAELKQRRAEQDRQLDKFTHSWIRTALRCVMSTRYEWAGGCIEYSLPWLLSALEDARRYGDPNLNLLYAWAMSQCDPTPTSEYMTCAEFSQHMCLVALDFPLALWRVSLWPVAADEHPHDDLAAPGVLPEKLPSLAPSHVDALADVAGVSMETFWRAAAKDGPARELLRQWLTRHTADQRDDLRKELKLKPLAGSKRDAAVDQILAAHTVLKLLPLPKRLAKS